MLVVVQSVKRIRCRIREGNEKKRGEKKKKKKNIKRENTITSEPSTGHIMCPVCKVYVMQYVAGGDVVGCRRRKASSGAGFVVKQSLKRHNIFSSFFFVTTVLPVPYLIVTVYYYFKYSIIINTAMHSIIRSSIQYIIGVCKLSYARLGRLAKNHPYYTKYYNHTDILYCMYVCMYGHHI